MTLCPEADKRARMTDAEFWDYVLNGVEPGENLRDGHFDDPFDSGPPDIVLGSPCPVCGALGECGFDAEGRPMIHCVEENG